MSSGHGGHLSRDIVDTSRRWWSGRIAANLVTAVLVEGQSVRAVAKDHAASPQGVSPHRIVSEGSMTPEYTGRAPRSGDAQSRLTNRKSW